MSINYRLNGPYDNEEIFNSELMTVHNLGHDAVIGIINNFTDIHHYLPNCQFSVEPDNNNKEYDFHGETTYNLLISIKTEPCQMHFNQWLGRELIPNSVVSFDLNIRDAIIVNYKALGNDWLKRDPNLVTFRHSQGTSYVNHPCFSDLYEVDITIGGRVWKSAEHFIQAQKFINDEDHYEIIFEAASAMDAARLGQERSIPIRSDWEQVKEEIYYVALMAKFTHNDLKRILLGTGNQTIKNNSLLMRVRSELV